MSASSFRLWKKKLQKHAFITDVLPVVMTTYPCNQTVADQHIKCQSNNYTDNKALRAWERVTAWASLMFPHRSSVWSPRLRCNLARFSFLWLLPASKDLFPMQCLCNLDWLYASVPPLSMYMQEHPSSVCILSASTAPLSLRINVIAQLSVSLTSTLLL